MSVSPAAYAAGNTACPFVCLIENKNPSLKIRVRITPFRSTADMIADNMRIAAENSYFDIGKLMFIGEKLTNNQIDSFLGECYNYT